MLLIGVGDGDETDVLAVVHDGLNRVLILAVLHYRDCLATAHVSAVHVIAAIRGAGVAPDQLILTARSAEARVECRSKFAGRAVENFAVQIGAVSDAELAKKYKAYRENMANEVMAKNKKLQEDVKAL